MLRAAAQLRPQATCAVAGLILVSKADRMVSARASEAIARQFNWPIKQHMTAGHDLAMDDARWAAEKLVEWLKTKT